MNDNIDKTNLIANSYFQSSIYSIYRFDEIGDYAFIDYAIVNYENNISKAALNKIYNQSGFFKIINESENNLDKDFFTYINGEGNIYVDDLGLHRLDYQIQKCTISKDLYQKTIKEEIYKSKIFFGGAFSNLIDLDDRDGMTCKSEEWQLEYFNKNLKLISSIKDLFRDDVNYEEILQGKYKEYITNNYPELTDENLLENILVTLTYKFDMKYQIVHITGAYGTIDISFDELIDYM